MIFGGFLDVLLIFFKINLPALDSSLSLPIGNTVD
tara:strand:- start:88 stop:192 length:105 start_codon:yes stop_codon:yes gene_type:complete